MGGGVEQTTVIALAMHFQKQLAQLLKQAHAYGLVIDKSTGFAICGQAAAEYYLSFCRHGLV